MVVQEKACIKCGETKPLEMFEKDKRQADGRRNVCGYCRYEKRKASPFWESTRRQLSEYGRTWRRENPEYHKEYFQNNKEYFRNYRKRWIRNNKSRAKKMKSASHEARRYLAQTGLEYPDCRVCGEPSKHMHHEDYNLKTSVVFLCIECHRRVHSGLIECPKPIELQEIQHKSQRKDIFSVLKRLTAWCQSDTVEPEREATT